MSLKTEIEKLPKWARDVLTEGVREAGLVIDDAGITHGKLTV